MKNPVATSLLIVALCSISPVSAADHAGSVSLPAPLHLMNFSPSFAGHPSDLTLLARPLNHTIISSSDTLTFVAKLRTEGADVKRVEVVNRVNAESLRFDGRLEGAALFVRQPQSDLLKFTPGNGWNFKTSN